MKIHGSISKHSKIKAGDLAEARESRLSKDGIKDEASAPGDGQVFEASLQAALTQSAPQKSSKKTIRPDDAMPVESEQDNLTFEIKANKNELLKKTNSGDQFPEDSVPTDVKPLGIGQKQIGNNESSSGANGENVALAASHGLSSHILVNGDLSAEPNREDTISKNSITPDTALEPENITSMQNMEPALAPNNNQRDIRAVGLKPDTGERQKKEGKLPDVGSNNTDTQAGAEKRLLTNDIETAELKNNKFLKEAEISISEAKPNADSKIKDILSEAKRADSYARSGENNSQTQGLEVIDPTVTKHEESPGDENPIKELEKLSRVGSSHNIKRVGGENKQNDENNRPTVAANINTRSDKSAEKISKKNSGEENTDGGKNKSPEKKPVFTPVDSRQNRAATGAVAHKPRPSNELQWERAIRPSELNAELPRALASQADGSKSTMSFKLTPVSLGTLFVEVEISKGEVKAKFTAETKEAQAAIEANMPALKEKLADAGLKLTHSECGFERRDDSSSGSDAQKRQGSRRSLPNSEFTLHPEKEESATPRLRKRSGSIIEEFV